MRHANQARRGGEKCAKCAEERDDTLFFFFFFFFFFLEL